MGDEVPAEPGQDGQTLDYVANEAQLLLRAKNIKEYHSILTTAGSLTFPNGIAIDSGIVVTFKNKGIFDGNWIIQKYTLHLVDGKLMSEMEFRKCLIFPDKPANVQYVTQPSDQSDPDPDPDPQSRLMKNFLRKF
jgi:hypothetical protein